jgi:hypothetical protein
VLVTRRKKMWLAGIAASLALVIVAAFIAASILARRFEPMVREQAIRYLQQRFDSDVQIAALHITPPKVSALKILLKHGRGAMVSVEADGVSMRFNRGLPPLFAIRQLNFVIDLGTVYEKRKTVQFVSIQGMNVTIPPKGDRPDLNTSAASSKPSEPLDVLVQDVQIRDALLVLLPKDDSKKPLTFDIAQLNLKSVGRNSAMKYNAALTIPMPPGTLLTTGNFGPWASAEPGDTPLQGDYTFDKADLGVFKAIAGTLRSTGTFEGTLDSVQARGQATVPNFRLKSVGNPIPLSTRFEVLVDGTNGDTMLKPVQARLGHTSFTTTGAVIKHEKQPKRAINLKVTMPNGNMLDLLRLTAKGSPFMEGVITMKAAIDIPPLSGSVKEKLHLDGDFKLHDGKFLRSSIQDQIDQLSRRGQGQPKNQEIDNVFANMAGSFILDNQVMTFRSLSFDVPGARVAIAGDYRLDDDVVDFRGNLKLDAKLSQTMTGWKRWVLRPVDPFFAKNGAGTFLRIKVDGSSHEPKFGLDRSHKSEPAPPAASAPATARQKSSPHQASAQSHAPSRARSKSPQDETTSPGKESYSPGDPPAAPNGRPGQP